MTWTKVQIRAARKMEIAPALRARGLQLQSLPGGNFRVVEHHDLVVKRCYWRWPSQDLDGNAIDYFMLVEGKTFNQAMEALVRRNNDSENRSKLPSYAQPQKPQETPRI